jgi:acetyl-CoA carboxylase biotin carboxyl carrier protein
MDLDQLREILDLVKQHDLSEFEVEHEGLRLKIKKGTSGALVPVLHGAPALPAPAMAVAPPNEPAPAAPTAALDQLAGDEIEFAIVKSPIVGTFYRSPEPTAPSFVEVGSRIKKGQVLCIIEAMKLMNEIDSEFDGEVANVYVESGQPVQYGERLFAIRTT